MTADNLSASLVRAHASHRFSATPEVVFDAWLSQKSIATWMFGSEVRNEEIVSILLDPRVEGRFSFVVARQGRRVDHIGRYLEISRPGRLSFTWGVKQGGGDNSVVSIDIVAQEDGCELKLEHSMPSQWKDYVAKVEESWTTMLASLARKLAATE